MRCFIGIQVSDKIKKKCYDLTESLQNMPVKAKIIQNDNLHVTLSFLGDIELDDINEIKDRVKRLNTHHFTISFSGIGTFPVKGKPRILWVGINKGKDELIRICRFLGGKDPHLTIARIKASDHELKELI